MNVHVCCIAQCRMLHCNIDEHSCSLGWAIENATKTHSQQGWAEGLKGVTLVFITEENYLGENIAILRQRSYTVGIVMGVYKGLQPMPPT